MTIGTVVLVNAVASRAYDGKRRSWYSLPLLTPTKGMITGLGKRYDGVIELGYGGEEPEPNYFHIVKQHRVWLVRFGLSRKEVPVFHRDLTVVKEPWSIPYQ